MRKTVKTGFIPSGLWVLVICLCLRDGEAFSRPTTVNCVNSRHIPPSTITAPRRTILSVTALATKEDKRNPELDDTNAMFELGEQLLNGLSCANNNNGLELNFTHAPVRKKDLIPNAPHLTFQKFLTMQEKRVVVSFRFTDYPYLRPYFLTFASKLKKKHSDIIIEKRTLPVVEANSQPIFEVLVDGKIVMGGGSNSRERNVLGGRVDVQNTQSLFVSMEHIGMAITKARRKRRPTTLYGQEEEEDDADSADSPTKRWHRSYLRNNGKKQSTD